MSTLEAIVFDMDGTILHSLPDLVACANEAFSRMGFPARSESEFRKHMGGGGVRLIDHVVPAEATAEQRRRAFEWWRSLYIASDYALTAPFPGVVDVLAALRTRGMKTAVLSNKFDEGVHMLAERHFPGLFDAVRGDKPPAPTKPDPTTLLKMLDDLGVRPEAAAYVGDTNIDVQTARNAGVMAIGVSWGYDRANPLRSDELDAYLHEPADLLDVPRVRAHGGLSRGGDVSGGSAAGGLSRCSDAS